MSGARSLGQHGAFLDPTACLLVRGLLREALASLARQHQPRPPGVRTILDAVAPAADAAWNIATAPSELPAPEVGEVPAPEVVVESSVGVTAVAARLGCSDSWVRHLCRAGAVPGARHVQGRWLIPPAALEELDQRRTSPA